MTNKLDNILLCSLWLTISTLCICFWFNIRFGFNIFSKAHWHHLAYMQASQNPVSPTFYISIVIAIIVIILGMGILFRPNKKNIHTAAPTKPRQTPHPTASATTTPASSPFGMSRPPRLNISSAPSIMTPPPSQKPQPAPSEPELPSNSDWPQIRNSFENAGYKIMNNAQLGPIKTSLFAIGSNETVWIGAVGVSPTSVQDAIDTIAQVFSDTLDDIEITINGFVVSPRETNTTSQNQIITFDTPNALDAYISQHPNPPISPEDQENFDAFAEYISTVINYLGKL